MKYIKTIIISAIVVLLLYIAFQGVNFKEVGKIISGINPFYSVIFLFGAYIQYFFRAYRWGLILKPYKEHIPLMTLYNYTAIGFILNLLPGRVGEAAKGILIAREEKFEKSSALASVVLERMIDLITMLALFLIYLIFAQENQSAFFLRLKKVSFYMVPVVLFVFVMFYLMNVPAVFRWIEKTAVLFAKLVPHRFREKVTVFILDFFKALKLNLGLLDYLKLILSSVLIWGTNVVVYWIFMKGFGIHIPFIETVPYLCILVVFAIVPTPGMGGTFEAGSKLGLTKLYGVANDTAMAYTILAHVWITVVWILPGLISLWIKGLSLNIVKNIKNEKEESTEDNKEENKEENTPAEKETDDKKNGE